MSGIKIWFSSMTAAGSGLAGATRWCDPSMCNDFDKVTVIFCGKPITVNKTYKNKFALLSTMIGITGHASKIYRVDSLACRKISAGSSTWSYHSFGQAIDINPSDFYATSAGRYTLPDWYNNVLDAARSLGFRCGADWTTYFDPMHIEIGSKINR